MYLPPHSQCGWSATSLCGLSAISQSEQSHTFLYEHAHIFDVALNSRCLYVSLSLSHTHTHKIAGDFKIAVTKLPQLINKVSAEPKVSLQHAATHCNSLQLAATPCNTLQHSKLLQPINKVAAAAAKVSLQHTATRCNTLQHTAIHC